MCMSTPELFLDVTRHPINCFMLFKKIEALVLSYVLTECSAASSGYPMFEFIYIVHVEIFHLFTSMFFVDLLTSFKIFIIFCFILSPLRILFDKLNVFIMYSLSFLYFLLMYVNSEVFKRKHKDSARVLPNLKN